MRMDVPSPATLRRLIVEELTAPVLFHNMINHWSSLKWTPEYLASIFGDQEFTSRVAVRNSHEVQWETRCHHDDITMRELFDWSRHGTSNRLTERGYSSEEHWCYIDYKYMLSVFKDRPDLLQGVKWDQFGFAERGGEASTLWVGTGGANTVCHYDTYGCNLVAQIHGKKTWVLFPPSDTDRLYPTRVPYEESSLFSEVCVRWPDLARHPLYANARPYVVTLEPGQVLFVPRHWWHYVESESTSISINTWIELEADHRERVKEAVCRTLVYSLVGSGVGWINPTEEHSTQEECFALVRDSLDAFAQRRGAKPEGSQSSVRGDERTCDRVKSTRRQHVTSDRSDHRENDVERIDTSTCQRKCVDTCACQKKCVDTSKCQRKCVECTCQKKCVDTSKRQRKYVDECTCQGNRKQRRFCTVDAETKSNKSNTQDANITGGEVSDDLLSQPTMCEVLPRCEVSDDLLSQPTMCEVLPCCDYPIVFSESIGIATLGEEEGDHCGRDRSRPGGNVRGTVDGGHTLEGGLRHGVRRAFMDCVLHPSVTELITELMCGRAGDNDRGMMRGHRGHCSN